MISSIFALPNQVKADPPPARVPQVFCFKIMDVAISQTTPGRVTIEFEALNWSDTPADGIEMILAQPVNGDVTISSASIDSNGRPLYPVDVNGDSTNTDPPDAGDMKDTNTNGILDIGEDTNNSGRLDNDPAPGNLATSNGWSATSVTATKVVWSANVGGAIPNQDLIGAGSIAAASALIPHVAPQPPGPLGQTTVDNNGLVTPLEAIDDGNNVLDGFTVTFDSFDVGDTVTLNWMLTSNGNPIGTSQGGNGYGFGTISFARITPASSLPAGVFVPNTGFAQTQTEFFDSTFVISQTLAPLPPGQNISAVPDSVAEFGAEFGAGLYSVPLNPSDACSTCTPNVIPINSPYGSWVLTINCTLISDPFGHWNFIANGLACNSGETFTWEYSSLGMGSFNSPGNLSVINGALTTDNSHGATLVGNGVLPEFGNSNLQIDPSFFGPPTDITFENILGCGGCPPDAATNNANPVVYSFPATQKPQLNDIFVDGFESGDVSGWSSGDTATLTFSRPMMTNTINPISGNDLIFKDPSGNTVSLGVATAIWSDSQTLVITAGDTAQATIGERLFVNIPSSSSLMASDGITPVFGDSPLISRGTLTVPAPPPAPFTILFPSDGATVGPNPILVGNGFTPGETVTVTSGTSSTSTIANDDGFVSTELISLNLQSTAPITVTNSLEDSAHITLNIDSTPPSKPTITTSGTIDGKGTISGTAEPGSTVIINSGDIPIGSATTDGDGNWSITPELALAERQHTLTVTATDSSGNTSVPSDTKTITVVTTSDVPKDWTVVPTVVNIMDDAMFNGNLDDIIKNANKLLSKLNTKLVVVDTNNGVAAPEGVTNDGTYTTDEADKVQKQGQNELKNNASLKGKGLKITFAKDVWTEEPGTLAWAIHRQNSLMSESSGNAVQDGTSIAHEIGHVITLEHSEETGNADDDPESNPMKTFATGFETSNEAGKGIDNMDWSDSQKEEIKNGKVLNKIGLSGTKNSPGVMSQFQDGINNDPNDDSSGVEHTELVWAGMSSTTDISDLNFIINLNGNFPQTGSFDATYSILFDSDANTSTGNTVGSVSGVDKELVLRISATNANGRFDCSNVGALCTATLIDHSSTNLVNLAETPRIVDGELWQDRTGLVLLQTQQIILDIPKSILSLTATDIPVTIMVRDAPTPFEPFTEFDTLSLTFETDRYLDFPTISTATDPAASGSQLTVDYAGLTANIPFDVVFDEIVVLSGTTSETGSGSATFTVPQLTSGDYFITIQDATGLFAGNLVTVQSVTPPVITTAENTIFTTSSVTLSGTSDPNVTIEIFHDVTSLGTTTADANGNWSFNTTLIDSTYTLTATASDGQSTSAASAPLNITVNTTGFTLTAWTQRVVDLRAAKSTAFQNTFPIGTESEINRLLAWAGNPTVQTNNPTLDEFGHMYSPIKRWNERTDLQNGFPTASLGADMVPLLIWSGRDNVLANSFNSDLVPHAATYKLLRIYFLERDDLRNNPVYDGADDGSDPSRLYCWAKNSQDTRLTPHQSFYAANCVL